MDGREPGHLREPPAPLARAATHGDEKSVFKFGGSAIAVFGEPGKWRPSDDLIAQTKEGIESFARLGETIARRA
jgi:phosphatidylserine decarboxylase